MGRKNDEDESAPEADPITAEPTKVRTGLGLLVPSLAEHWAYCCEHFVAKTGWNSAVQKAFAPRTSA